MCPGFFRLLTLAGDTQEMDGEYLAHQLLQATLLSWQFRNGKNNPREKHRFSLCKNKALFAPCSCPDFPGIFLKVMLLV